MRLPRAVKIGLCLSALMLVSGLAGFLAGHRFARQQIEGHNDPGNWNEHVSREFDRLVRPTPEQATKIQTFLDGAVRQLQEIRFETIARSTNVIWRLIADVETQLTPEQRQAFEQMKPKPADLTLDVLKVKPQDNRDNSPKP